VGRLCYQSELLAKTPELSGRRFASDAELALAVFGARGPQGLTTLEGEFALVVAEPAEGRLYALRDPMGSWPLYWTTSGGRLRVGTGLLDLARRAGGAGADLDHLATFLMWSFPSCELPHEHTTLRPIRRVLPGRLLRFGPEEAVAVLHEHAWPVAAPADPMDGARRTSASCELFRAAVRERIDPAGKAAREGPAELRRNPPGEEARSRRPAAPRCQFGKSCSAPCLERNVVGVEANETGDANGHRALG
jgi:asparagine synthase (glutamine-hydrolysing)